ncbi:MAG: MFS transporter [Pseudomonadota bacterium]
MTLAFGARQPCDNCSTPSGVVQQHCEESRRSWVLAAAICGSSLAFIEGSVVNLALPDLQAALGLSAEAVQWTVNIYLLVVSALLLVGGASGDRFGLRRVFVCGILFFGVASLAAALAPTLNALLLARTVQGMAAAAVIPTSLALISVHFPESERGKAIGLWAGASALTTSLGPVLGGNLVDQFGWPSVFMAMVPLAGMTALLTVYRVPPSAPRPGATLDLVGATLIALALATITFASLQKALNATTIAAVVMAIASGLAWVRWERQAPNAMVPLSLFLERRFAGANLMTLLLYFALSGVLFFLPFNLIQIQGYSAAQAGAAFLPLTLLIGIGSSVFGERLSQHPPHRVLTLGAFITACGYVALSLPGSRTSYLQHWLPGIVLVGLGMTLVVAPLTTVVMGAVSSSQAGVASGINNTASRIAGVLALALLSAVAVAGFELGLLELADDGLSRLEHQYLIENAERLAGLTADPILSEAQRSAVEAAYIGVFRRILWVCAGLALGSALIAWVSLRVPLLPSTPARPGDAGMPDREARRRTISEE